MTACLSGGYRRKVVGVVTLSLTLLTFAPTSAAPVSDSGQRPQFEAAVARVAVDVVVTDSDGQFVDDLKVEDFDVFEDGMRQRVLDAQYVDWVGGSPFESDDNPARSIAGREAAAPAQGRSSLLPKAPETGSTALGAIVYVLDIPGLDSRRRERFVEAWQEILSDASSTRLPRAVYAIDQDYRVQKLVRPTYDRTKLEAAAESLAAVRALRSDFLGAFLTDLANTGSPAGLALAEERAHQERSRAISMLRALAAICDSLESPPRRTALVWVSSGIMPRPRQLSTRSGIEAMASDPQITDAQQELYRAANNANVSIYSVDPGRLVDRSVSSVDVQRRGTPSTAPRTIPPPGSSAASGGFGLLRTLAEPLRDASRATAGRAFVAWADLGAALESAERDTSRYYLVTYASPRPDGDGEYHEVRVEVRRPDVQVRARSGYVAHSDAERLRQRVRAALSTPALAGDLPLTAEGYRSWSATGEPRFMLLVDTRFTRSSKDGTTGDGQAPDLELVAVVLNEDGDTLDEIRQPLIRADESQKLEADSTRVFSYRQTWELPAGRYEIRLAIADRILGRVGAKRLEFTLPTSDGNPWLLADPVVVSAATSADPLEPVPSNRIVYGARTGIYLEVNNGAFPVARALVSPARDSLASPLEAAGDRQGAAGPGGHRVYEIALELRDGVHRGTIRLPGLPPGTYSLTLEVADESVGESNELEMDLRIVEEPRYPGQ